MAEDTIAAISTANGAGGVAVLRISGEKSLAIAQKMFAPIGKTKVVDFKPYQMYAGDILAEHFTDFGLCVYFRAPKSYTGEDIVEFHCHGGTQIAQGILRRIYDLGARPAEAGEFTKRAFLNGKMTLSAAEGVIDMINARSESMIRAGFSLYQNELGEKVKAAQDKLTNILAGIGADIDYPEEDLQDSLPDLVNIQTDLQTLHQQLKTLEGSYTSVGRRVKDGITVAIVGKPNSGKSSLLNAILGYERAIVSDIQGTTRDIVEGNIAINGLQYHIFDTAGIRESKDVIEKIGVEKAERLTDEADVVLHVVDAGVEIDSEDKKLNDTIRKKERLLHLTVFNKTDVVERIDEIQIFDGVETVCVSAKNNENVDKLLQIMGEVMSKKYTFNDGFVVEERHYRALKEANERLLSAYNGCKMGIPLDMITVDITKAWQLLGEITGETANEEIISEIFAKFCVGK